MSARTSRTSFSSCTVRDYNVERAQRGIVYIDEIDKISRKSDNPSVIRDVSARACSRRCSSSWKAPSRGTTAGRPQTSAAGIPAGRHHQYPIRLRRRVSGLEKIISARSRPGSIGFGAKVIAPEDRKQGEIFREVEPEDLLKYGDP